MFIEATAPSTQLTDFVSLANLSPAQLQELLDLAAYLKRRPFNGAGDGLRGRSVALLFEKPSLRTRTTFEVGIHQLGGHSVYLGKDEVNLGVRETVADVAHNLERWVDIVVIRTFAHARVEELATYACIPVVNALSDFEHPCQALADMLTLREHLGSLQGASLTYIGDGNNVSHSLLYAGAAAGLHLRICTPPGYGPDHTVVEQSRAIAAETGATITLTHDPEKAVRGAQAVYTDAWASMGHEAEHETRLPVFLPYQVNEALMAEAAAGALFMHCLPAHRGEEVTDAVIDAPTSVVFDQAENRLHTQKALLTLLAQG